MVNWFRNEDVAARTLFSRLAFLVDRNLEP